MKKKIRAFLGEEREERYLHQLPAQAFLDVVQYGEEESVPSLAKAGWGPQHWEDAAPSPAKLMLIQTSGQAFFPIPQLRLGNWEFPGWEPALEPAASLQQRGELFRPLPPLRQCITLRTCFASRGRRPTSPIPLCASPPQPINRRMVGDHLPGPAAADIWSLSD